MNISSFKQTILHPQTEKQKSDRRKIIGATAAVALPTAVLAIGIGRDPIKAAKHLKGNLNMRKKAFKTANELIEESMKKNSVIKDFIEKINIKQYIKDMPDELMPKDKIFYHGTRRSSGIYRHGLNPYSSGQLGFGSREVGAGLYLTPNEKVAHNFTYITGKIIPVKIDNAKIGIITEETMQKIMDNLPHVLTDLVDDPMTLLFKKKKASAITELLIRKIFTEAGYDGVYLDKAVTSGILKDFLPDTNKVFGMDQKQLVLFNTEKAEIVSRSFKQRFKDMGYSTEAFARSIKNTATEFVRIIKNLNSIMHTKD